jgi:CheY-like chemotaxis protein
MAKTLLLADDSVTIQKVVGISLASEDIRLVVVDNGDDALARARELRPDAILADCVMPGRSGYEVCEAIHSDPSLRHIPVLLLTGTFEAFDEERALRCGAAGHIAKPFEAQTLVDEVSRLLALAEARKSSRLAAAPAKPRPAPTATPAPPRPAAAPAGAQGAAPGFDFFDDEIDDLLPAEIAEEPGAGHELELDLAHEPAGAEAALRPPSAQPERTVAMLPDAVEESAIEIGGELDESAATIGEADLARLDSPSQRSAAERTLVLDGLEAFATEPPAQGDPSPLRVDPGDFAGATLLDPAGAAGFDVSASDLDDRIEEPRAALQAPERAPRPAPASLELLEPEPEPPPQPDFPEDRTLALEPELPEERAGDADVELAELARSALDAVTPRLRAQLHDTLEKVAWESLSDVTDQIVRQALERIEAIAWEVIPQMAETLIREEIRRMKGEDGSQT